MQRIFAALVVVLGLSLSGVAYAQVDAAPPDAAASPDAAVPDAAPSPDSAFYPPALDEEDGCDCRAGGRGGPGAIALAAGLVALGLRRRRR